MKSRPLLLALFLAACGAALLLGRGCDRAHTAREGEAPTASSKPSETLPDPFPPAEKHPLPSLDARPESGEPTRVATHKNNPDATFDTKDARLIPIRVNLPSVVPADDELWLYAFAHPDGSPWGDFERRTAAQQFEGSDTPAANLEQQDIVWARQRIRASGEVELPFPPHATGATVVLLSHYVISEPVTFSLGTRPPTIEGTLGAWITGTVLFPGESILDNPRPEELRLHVLLHEKEDFSPLGIGGGTDVRVQQDSRYSLPHLRTDATYTVLLPAKGRLDFRGNPVSVEPGEHVVLDLPLEVGAAVTGIVVDEHDVGIQGMWVFGDDANRFSASRKGGEEGVVTENDGVFRIAGLPPGEIELKVITPGWRMVEPTRLSVEAGEVATDVRIVLSRANQISGRVLWPDGRAAEGATVFTEEAGDLPWKQPIRATTDQEGAFLLSGLGEGPFDLTSTSTHEAPAPDTERAGGSSSDSPPESLPWRAFAKSVPPNATGIELVLTPPQSIRGFVLDDLGSPIPSFEVEAFEVGKERQPHLSTASSQTEGGAFELFGLHDGEWELGASSRGYFPSKDPYVFVRVPQGDEPIEIALQRAISVAGIVVDPSGSPVPNAHASYAGVHPFPVGPDGRFTVENVPPTGATFVARSGDWAPSRAVVVSGEPGTRLEDVVLTLCGGGTIVGEVLDEEGSPEAGVGIQVLDSKGESLSRPDVAARTDGSGRFRIEHVRAGEVHLLTAPNEEQVMRALESAKSQEEALAARVGRVRIATATVVGGEEVHVRLQFPDRKPVHVTGTILESGEPWTGAAVLVFEEDAPVWNGLQASLSDGDGRFDLTVDRPGDYVFRVRHEGPRSVPIPLHVTVPDTPEVFVKLNIPTGTLAGIVLSPAGDPAGGVPLRLRRSRTLPGILNFDPRSTVTTSDDGHFRFEHVQAGRVALLAGGNGSPVVQRTSLYATAVVGGVVLGPGEVRDDLVLRLPEAGTLEGHVRDEQGDAVSGAAVFVRNGSGTLLSNLATIRTDASGFFSYPGVPQGNAWVFAQQGNLTSEEAGPIAIHVGRSSTTSLTLHTGCFLTVVFEVDGEPARAAIRVFEEHSRIVSGTRTSDPFEDLYGTASSPREQRFGPLPPGIYTVTGEADGGRTDTAQVTVSPGEEERRVTLRSN